MTIITEFYHKIKLFIQSHIEEVGVSIIIVLVGISSFFLGKYSVINSTVSDDKITFTNGTLATTTPRTNSSTDKTVEQASLSSPTVEDNGGQVVASKNGTRYYFPWCGSAERILAKNKVFFASAKDAENAGFTKAANCKGM